MFRLLLCLTKIMSFWGGGGGGGSKGEDLSLYFKQIFLPSSCMEDRWDDSEGTEMEKQVIILIRGSAVKLRDIVIHFTGSTESGGPTGWEDFSMFW